MSASAVGVRRAWRLETAEKCGIGVKNSVKSDK